MRDADRFVDMLREQGLHPFPREWMPYSDRVEWAVSGDVRDRLLAHVEAMGGFYPASPIVDAEERVLGYPLVVDDALPPNAITLRPLFP